MHQVMVLFISLHNSALLSMDVKLSEKLCVILAREELSKRCCIHAATDFFLHLLCAFWRAN